jgi:hypothetical protein
MLKIQGFQGVRRPDPDWEPDPVGIELLSFVPKEAGGQGPGGELFLRGPLHTIDDRPHQITARRDGQILFTDPNRSYTLSVMELKQLNNALREYLRTAPTTDRLRPLVAQMQLKVDAAMNRR